MFHTVHETFHDSRHETSIDSTTNDRVNHNEFTTPIEFNFLNVARLDTIFLTVEFIDFFNRFAFYVRFNDEVNFTELTSTTRLFFVTIIATRSASDSFTIRDARFKILDLEFIVVFDTPFESTKVEFALTRNDSLTKFFTLFDNPSWIFFVHTSEDFVEFFFFTISYRFDSATIFWFWILDTREVVFTTFSIESITSASIFKFNSSTDITSYELVNFDTVLTSNAEELRDTFFTTITRDISKVVAFFESTAHNFEVNNLADMWFNRSFEYEDRSFSVFVRSNFFEVFSYRFWHIVNERNDIAEEFHQTTNAHIFA